MTEAGTAAARALAPEIYEGAVLSGRYRIGQLIGAGGMGAVFAAEHLDLGEPVAIKFILPDALAQSADLLSRFAREAWAASKIKSEYVARVNDVGRLENGTPFLVMEYLDGVDLAEVLLSTGRLEVEQAVEFMLQACEALAEAHVLGIVHRDLKPSNLFCMRRSDDLLAIKLLDFGISKVTPAAGSGADLSLTATSATVGSPLYMSPEQMSSARVADERSDIWSLGVILYELLTASLPFPADTLPELAIKVATEPPRSLRTLRADLSPALERVVLRCLEKQRDQRYANVAELAKALAPFGPARAIAHAERAMRVLSASGRPGPVLTRSMTSSSVGSHARLRSVSAGSRAGRSHSLRITLVAVVLAALIGGAAAFVRNSQSSSAAAVTAEPDQHIHEAGAAQVLPALPNVSPNVRAAQPELPAAEKTRTNDMPAAVSKSAPLKGRKPATESAHVRESVDRPRGEASRRTSKVRARPAAAATQSDLDSLGGRL